MLKVENLSIKYGGIKAVKNISFEVKEGSIVTLIGNNGAGKTSTLKSISGLVDKENGKVYFDGEDITEKKSHEIAKSGLIHIPEGRHIFPELTVMENLIISSSSRNIKKNLFNEEVEEVLKRFPILKKRYKQTAGTLSGGEQQMLAIARGILQAPKLLMLDEPSMGLAPLIVEEVYDAIENINEFSSTTILIVEQNAQIALETADYGYVLEVGEIILENEAKLLLNDPEIKKIYLGEN